MPLGRTLAAVFPLRYTCHDGLESEILQLSLGERRTSCFCENRWKRTASAGPGQTLNGYYAQLDLDRGGSPPELKGGIKRLPVDAVSFTDEITECDGKLLFYIPTYFDPDAVFGTHVCTDTNDDWVDVYAGFDWKTGRMDSALTVRLCCTDGHEFEFSYRLTPAEQVQLWDKMDAYCRQQNGQSLEEQWASFAANAGRRRNGDPDVGSTIRQPLPIPTVFQPVFYW